MNPFCRQLTAEMSQQRESMSDGVEEDGPSPPTFLSRDVINAHHLAAHTAPFGIIFCSR
jgi:hypothetical protein